MEENLMTSYIQSGIKYVQDSWKLIQDQQDEVCQDYEELTKGLQDHKRKPQEVYDEVKSKFGSSLSDNYFLSDDMKNQAIQLDKIVKSEDMQEWKKQLKISGSNVSEIVFKTPILNDIAGEPTWSDRYYKFMDGVTLASAGEITSALTRHPELQVRLCGAMKETIDLRIKEAVKALINFRFTARNPFACNASENLLTKLPTELRLSLLDYIGTWGKLFERMNLNEGVTYGDSYDITSYKESKDI
jgi:hypothetical protein